MKIIKYSILLFVSLTVLSCNKYLDTNISPNSTTQSSPDFVLSNAELALAVGLDSRTATNLAFWNQYWTGSLAVVTSDPDKNSITTSEGAQPWNTLYSNSLISLKYLIDKSEMPKYQGVAKILMAYEFQMIVDIYGDVPFTDALKGADLTPNRAPKPDKAENIYPQLVSMIDEGIALLSQGTENIKGDLIYNGDVTNWENFGNAIKLKLLMRQTNTGDPTIQTKVSDLINTVGITNIAVEAKIEFTEPAAGLKNLNPLYTEIKGGALGFWYIASATSIDFLNSTQDPRIDYLYDLPNGSSVHRGLLQGDQNNYSGSYSTGKGGKTGGDAHLFGPNVPFLLMSKWEIKLLLAEAASRTWIVDDAQSLYNEAVQDNFDYFEAGDASTYLSSGSMAEGTGGAFDATSLTTKLKSIALQKWVSMNGTQIVESWIETRRMDNITNPVFASLGGIFVTPPLSILPIGIFPSIYYYSEQETSLNPNIIQHQLTDKVFWDR